MWNYQGFIEICEYPCAPCVGVAAYVYIGKYVYAYMDVYLSIVFVFVCVVIAPYEDIQKLQDDYTVLLPSLT